MAFQPPVNKLLVSVRQKFRRGITNVVRAANLTESNQINPLYWVEVCGEVVALPKEITTHKRGYEGFSLKDIEVGDVLVFGYDVIGSYYAPDGSGEVKHKNEVFYKGKTFFTVDVTRAFARIREGDMRMLNGYLMVAPPVESKLILPQHLKRIRSAAESEVYCTGAPKDGEIDSGISVGDVVYYNPLTVEHYTISEKKFCILESGKVLGRKVG
jgi:co-chaperonin GroES (HSP10)